MGMSSWCVLLLCMTAGVLCLGSLANAATEGGVDFIISRPYRTGTFHYEDAPVSLLSQRPRVLRGMYLGQLDDDHKAAKANLDIGDLASFWIAEVMVAEAFGKLNRTVSLTPVGTYIRQGIALDNAGYDFLVLGGGSLLQRSQTYRALLFSNSRDTRNPAPVFLFGTGFDDETELLGTEFLDKLKQRLDLELANPGAVKTLPRSDFLIPAIYQRNLKISATLPAAGGVRGRYSSMLMSQIYSQSSVAQPLGDPTILANLVLSTSSRLGLPRFDKPLYMLNPGSQVLQYGAPDIAKVLGHVAYELVLKGAYVLIAPTHTADLSLSLATQRYSQVLFSNNQQQAVSRHVICLNECTHVVDMSEYLGYLKISEATVTYRVRAMTAAIAANTPFVALGYRFKHFDVAATYGLTDFVLRTDAPELDRKVLALLQTVAASRPLIQQKLKQVVLHTAAGYTEKLSSFAAKVVEDSKHEDRWTTLSQSLVGYPQVFQTWGVAPTHANVVLLSLVNANIPGNAGVSERITLMIHTVESQFSSRRLRQIVFVVTPLSPEILRHISTAMDGRVAEAQFIFTSQASVWPDIHTWVLEHNSWYANSTYYFRDLLYDSQRSSSLWDSLRILREDPITMADNFLLRDCVGSREPGFLDFVREQEHFLFPRLTNEQKTEILQIIKQKREQQQLQEQGQAATPSSPSHPPSEQDGELPLIPRVQVTEIVD